MKKGNLSISFFLNSVSIKFNESLNFILTTKTNKLIDLFFNKLDMSSIWFGSC